MDSIPIMLHNSVNFSFLPLFLFPYFVIDNTNCSETTLISFFITGVFFVDGKKISIPVVLEMNVELHFKV